MIDEGVGEAHEGSSRCYPPCKCGSTREWYPACILSPGVIIVDSTQKGKVGAARCRDGLVCCSHFVRLKPRLGLLAVCLAAVSRRPHLHGPAVVRGDKLVGPRSALSGGASALGTHVRLVSISTFQSLRSLLSECSQWSPRIARPVTARVAL